MTTLSTSSSYLEALNEHQKRAVMTTEGPVLIVAGAGAGKTKTITSRILHLIKKGVPPREILAITFTNKAAREMRERIAHFVEVDHDAQKAVAQYGAPFVSTFHALGVHILKEHGHHIGLSKYFTIPDKTDTKRLIKEATLAAQYDPKQFDPGKIQHMISRSKGEGVSLTQYKHIVSNNYFENVVLAVWEKYEEFLSREQALDFDDLLLKTMLLLERHTEVLKVCQKQFAYVHIDEYQDTNKVQDTIAELISQSHRNICVVGDTDQNIYSWRGANIQNMLTFEKKYPDATIIRLEENYRSTKTILSVANSIIQKNKYRIDKILYTQNEHGEKISLTENYDEIQEAYNVISRIKKYIQEGVSAQEIAILYRANFQSRVLEEACLTLSVPYQVVGVRFFDRKEIKDLLSYIRAARNNNSLSDIKRIINSPARGIGKVTVQKMLEGREEMLPAATRKKILDFKHLLTRIQEASQSMLPSELIKYTLKESGIENELQKGTEEDIERLENIQELVTLALSYDEYGPDQGIDRMLTDTALATDEEESGETRESSIRLMTVHAAKGLEFDYVFITGLEENLFPHRRNENAKAEDTEEERRLFYVALTRARKKIYLSYAQTRTIFGSRQVNIPSEFISDIEENHIEHEESVADTRPRKPLFRIDF